MEGDSSIECSPREWGIIAEEEVPFEEDELLNPVLLESPWTFWYDKYPGPGLSAEEYATCIKRLGCVDTIQDFWRYFNNLPALDEIPAKSSYHLMKKACQPLWEDEANLYGGTLAIKIKKTDSEHVWLQLVLRVIGEQLAQVLHDDDEIQGISVNVRADPYAVINIWNKRADLIDLPHVIEYIKSSLEGTEFLQEPTYRVHREELSHLLDKPSPSKHSKHHNNHKSSPAKGNRSPKRADSPPKASTPNGRGKSPPKNYHYNNHHHSPSHNNNYYYESSPAKAYNKKPKHQVVKPVTYYVPIAV